MAALPCTQSKRHRGRGGPAGGSAVTQTNLWTISVTPSHQHSSVPTADRWEDCDLTQPWSYRVDGSSGRERGGKRPQSEKKDDKTGLVFAPRYDLIPVTTGITISVTTGITCEFNKKLLGRDIGEAAEVPAIAMATVWLMRLLASPSASSPGQLMGAPCGPPGRPHWLWDSSDSKTKDVQSMREKNEHFYGSS